MIRGFFSPRSGRQRPLVNTVLTFPSIGHNLKVRLLVDTGADRTVLAHLDTEQLVQRSGIDLSALPKGDPSMGIGGRMETRMIDAGRRVN